MKLVDLAVDSLSGNLQMLMGHLSDFSEADMLVRPVPNANHTTWQLGHLILAETGMVNSVKPGAGATLPDGFAEKFTKETAKLDDAKAFPTKAEILDTFSKVRAASIAWAKTITEADVDTETNERIRRFAPTVGHLLMMMPIHTTMHIGQFQVIRRKLGRPVMF
jgi:hypothetical protein